MPLLNNTFLTVYLQIVTFFKESLNSRVKLQMLNLRFEWTVPKMTFLSFSVNFEGLPDLGESSTVSVSLNFLNVFQMQSAETSTTFAIATLDWFPCFFKPKIRHLMLSGILFLLIWSKFYQIRFGINYFKNYLIFHENFFSWV